MSNSENNHPHDTQGINTLKRDSVIRLVDDDPSVLRALTTFLQMDDWQVRCFKSGIDFLHTPGKEPGCVILVFFTFPLFSAYAEVFLISPMMKDAIICQNNFRHSFSLTWSGKTCDIRRSL